jgi:ABC-2 type transport system permease protein
MAQSAVDQAISKADLSVEILPADADEAKEKASLAEANVHAKEGDGSGPPPRVALAVIPAESVQPRADGSYAPFNLYTAPKLDFEVKDRIEEKVGEAIVDARIRSDQRLNATGLSTEAVRSILRSPKSIIATVTREGDKKDTGAFQFFLPMAFMGLLLMSIMTGGQYLLTTTVEEKSSRVMEVLLSAVSPLQLMVGKIIGQMCVGLMILTVYSGVGIAGLVVFSLMHMLDPMLLVYMFIFFFIAFFTIASLMAAAGSAVSEMREAQTLMTPIMVIVMLPWLLWMPISRAPNSLFSTLMSFTPGINPFVMMIRLTGSEPPPAWQIPVAILIGLITVVIASWAAAKIFRIGVLLYGKPPNLRTLIRWVRMA